MEKRRVASRCDGNATQRIVTEKMRSEWQRYGKVENRIAQSWKCEELYCQGVVLHCHGVERNGDDKEKETPTDIQERALV